MRNFKGLVISIAVIFLSSCTTRVPLSYTPAMEKKESNNIGVFVNSFEDNRPAKQVLGSKRNGYGIPVVKIVTDDSVSEWMSNALKAELTNAGFSVATESPEAGYEIHGKVLKSYVTTYFIYHGRMSVEICVKQGENTLFKKVYYTDKSGGMNWAASDKSCVKTLERNLQLICRQFISDFNHQVLATALNTTLTTN